MRFLESYMNQTIPNWAWIIIWVVIIGVICICSFKWTMLSKTIIDKCKDGKMCTYKY